MEEIYELTREEIGKAIVRYIGLNKVASSFFPYQIVGCDPELDIPKEVQFRLKSIPKGSLIRDYLHILSPEVRSIKK